jgi:hypothetical protein
MDDDFTVSAPDEAETFAAVRAVEAMGLLVLDRGWVSASGDNRLAVVATPGQGIAGQGHLGRPSARPPGALRRWRRRWPGRHWLLAGRWRGRR